ncbi:hypothetical protein C8255_22500 [filamentous cyanobacterium CCP3]|nr:hypothetical protein C8255_22500 [filamentous cyanobacterium CCP3]
MSTYGGFIERLSRKVTARLSDIEAVFNFDLGDEYEVAMCHLLEDVLPNKFGVCRGFVVAEDGELAGDDIIIYDKLLSPTLRSSVGVQYAVKEQIPVDAVYAYIECKHSIKDEEVFNKAMKQVREVKKLLFKRRHLINETYEVDGPRHNGKVKDWPRQFPKLKNQPFCVIVARESNGKVPKSIIKDSYTPDLLILGEDYIVSQSAVLDCDGIRGTLFYDDCYWAGLRVDPVQGNAFGIGLVSLIQAISWIELIPIDWATSLNTAYATAVFGK